MFDVLIFHHVDVLLMIVNCIGGRCGGCFSGLIRFFVGLVDLLGTCWGWLNLFINVSIYIYGKCKGQSTCNDQYK